MAFTPHVDETAEGFSVAPVNDWSYLPAGPTDEPEISIAARFAEIKDVWYAVEPSPFSSLVAHTFLLFEFTDHRVVGVSIEARQQQNETYSPWLGLFNYYELLFQWATARDLLERRAVFLNHDVFVYRVKFSPAHARSLLRKFLATTDQLEHKPRFYNTLFHNCTTELAKEMGFSWNPAFVLTGRSVRYLYGKGVIAGPSVEVAMQRAKITDWLRAENNADKTQFYTALLSELRARDSATALQAGQ